MSVAAHSPTSTDDTRAAGGHGDRAQRLLLRSRRATAAPSAAPPSLDVRSPNVVLQLPPVDPTDQAGVTTLLDDGPAGDAPAGTSAAATPQLHPATPRVSVVIPTYNEAKNLPHVFKHLPEGLHEVIVVDGRSVDDTIAVAHSLMPEVKIVLQNRAGKGNAMACGFAAVTGDIVVMLDADGSADPDEISRFVAALVDGADFAKGSRFAPGGGSSDITPLRAWGNRWLNRIANLLFGTRYTDLCYGYNAFWRHCLDALELDPRVADQGGKQWGDGFEIETIINTRIAKARLTIAEVPSYELPRIHGQSNLDTWRDGTRVLGALVVERISRAGRRTRRAARQPV